MYISLFKQYVYTLIMATIQSKKSRGHKYWYIVESRRVNGKPRPIVLAYLGKADALLKRLHGLSDNIKLKSYSHGCICALLNVAGKLDIVTTINKYINSSRQYMPSKPIRNNLTAGATFLLAAIGRVCMPTSKRGWWSWAKTTSLEYLLRCNFNKIDSQHFWDLMDSMPVQNIEKAEHEILKRVLKVFNINSDTLLYDTTNFFTYIDTTNIHCEIAQRGKNKQKRYDLRQVGLAMVVTKQDYIPLFHHSYQGNMNDSKVFKKVVEKIKIRMESLGMDIKKHTLVFDRGNNSKINLGIVKDLGIYYVGALTPFHHQSLIERSMDDFTRLKINCGQIDVYREKLEIYGEERTVVVFISDKLKAGQLRGIYQSLAKKQIQLNELQKQLANPRAKKRERSKLEEKIMAIAKGQFLKDIINWSLEEISEGKFLLKFDIEENKIRQVEEKLGFRIIMTNRHEWKSEEIIQAYYGQSVVEHAFKNLKNPYHLSLKPQYHWTDQKIEVHYFICVLGYLLTSLVWRQLKLKLNYKKSLDTLLDTLNNIRLATMLEESKKPGRIKAIYKLEEMTDEEYNIMKALNIIDYHKSKPIINGVGIYN